MFKRLLFLCFLTIGLSEDFLDGPYGSGYFDIAGPFTLIDLNLELGDVNSDNTVNILDIITVVNCILYTDCNVCFDINYDSSIDILDIISMINIILED